MDAEAVLRHEHAGELAGHAADVLARAHGGNVGGRIRRGDGVARPYAHLLQLAEDAVHNGEGDFLRQAAALVGLQNDRVGAYGAQRAGQRGGEGALVRVDPDELRAERADAGQKPLGFLRADAHLIQFALVARAGVKIQHEIRAAHILNHLMAHVFKRRAVRRAGESAVHIQPRARGHQTLADVQTERVEHGVKIHRAAERVRMFADALLHQIDDELTHHFVAVRARSDADAAGGRTVGGVPAALDAPSLLDAKGMSIGYLMNDSIKDWYYDSAYPFRVQNDLAEQAFDVFELFHDIEIDDPATNGCTASKTNDGEYYFEYGDSRPDNMTFTIPITETAENLYLFYDGTQVENAQIMVDGTNVKSGDLDGYMLPIGKVSAGSEVKVTFELKGETEDGYVRLSAADFDQEVFEDFKKTAAEQAFTVTDYSSNSLEGTVDASDNQTLFLSIPYDSGWKVKVDGKEVKTCRIGDAFLGVKVPSGEHTVSLKYTPPGFSIGWKVSLAAAIIFIVLCFVKYRYKADIKKKE